MNIYLEKLRLVSEENKYFRIYCSIIEQSKMLYETRKSANEKIGYSEAHHIFPSSFCEDDCERKDKDNICFLSARQHFIVHRLLTKFVSNPSLKNKMFMAIFAMSRKSRSQKRSITLSRTYEKIKRDMAESKKGVSPGNKGIPLSEKHKEALRYERSEETKRKISEAKKDNPISEEIKSHLSKINKGEGNPFYGMKHTEEARAKMSKAKRGKKQSPRTKEHRENISKSLKGRKLSEKEKEKRKSTYLRGKDHQFYGGLPEHMKVVCIHCGLKLSKGLHTRWHGDKCKFKNRTDQT